jgi:hypothetical protein
VLLAHDTGWGEIREIMTESCRVIAPKKLNAMLD